MHRKCFHNKSKIFVVLVPVFLVRAPPLYLIHDGAPTHVLAQLVHLVANTLLEGEQLDVGLHELVDLAQQFLVELKLLFTEVRVIGFLK
jgi:hypothetical protein